MAIVTSSFKRPYFRPTVPSRESEAANGQDTIASLPHLIQYNAKENPDHIFCVQAEVKSNEAHDVTDVSRFDARRITFSQLDRAVDTCATWIHKIVKPSSPLDTSSSTPRPIALYLESDVGLFIHLAALLTMDVPVWLPEIFIVLL